MEEETFGLRYLLLLFLLLSCEDDRLLTDDVTTYSYETICDCYDSGINILGSIIDIRIEYNTYEEYALNNEDVSRVENLKNLFNELRMNCLYLFGAQLFISSDCNYPCDIEIMVHNLFDLGIDVNEI